MRIAYFDCFSGVSGDMTVGALLDAGADWDALCAAVESFHIDGLSVSRERITKRGIAATHFKVHAPHPAHSPHRHLPHIEAIIRGAALPSAVQEAAIATFRRLGEAEAAVHNTTLDRVHFHEVGAVDSIVDIVLAQLALHTLGVGQVACSALAVGFGTVRCDHGVLPVPAPATALLLQGKPTYGGEVEGEMVTPTGAALMAECAASFGSQPRMAVETIGYGAGTRDYAQRANVLRVIIGEAAEATSIETIAVIETAVDDMNPELLPVLIEALLEAGARDAYVTPALGKKGRLTHTVTALAAEPELEAAIRAMFANAPTLGLRVRREERRVLERAFKTAETPWGPVRVKLGYYAGAQNSAAPEFEECRRLAQAAGVPARRVYEAALAEALKGSLKDA